VAHNEKVSSSADTINALALRRASIGAAPLPPLAKGGVLVEVELDKIEPNPDQPRQWIDPEKVEELAASIASRGTRQPDNPILLRLAPGGDRFVLVSGERRWRAKQLLREQAPAAERQLWNTIKALLHDDIDDEKSAFIALEENLQREDLSSVEEGAAYVRLMEKYELSARALAERIGKDVRRVQSMVRLHSAPEFLKDAVMKGILVPSSADADPTSATRRSRRKLEFRAAVEFMRLYDHLLNRDPRTRESAKAQDQVAERIDGWVQRALTDSWTVRRIEERCALLRGERQSSPRSESTEAKRALDVSSGRIVVDRRRVATMTPEEVEALKQQLLGLIGDSQKTRVHMEVQYQDIADRKVPRHR
jgi:ParB/RepB/Spo0J family partition protein